MKVFSGYFCSTVEKSKKGTGFQRKVCENETLTKCGEDEDDKNEEWW